MNRYQVQVYDAHRGRWINHGPQHLNPAAANQYIAAAQLAHPRAVSWRYITVAAPLRSDGRLV